VLGGGAAGFHQSKSFHVEGPVRSKHWSGISQIEHLPQRKEIPHGIPSSHQPETIQAPVKSTCTQKIGHQYLPLLWGFPTKGQGGNFYYGESRHALQVSWPINPKSKVGNGWGDEEKGSYGLIRQQLLRHGQSERPLNALTVALRSQVRLCGWP
jgi:hypothetical protein